MGEGTEAWLTHSLYWSVWTKAGEVADRSSDVSFTFLNAGAERGANYHLNVCASVCVFVCAPPLSLCVIRLRVKRELKSHSHPPATHLSHQLNSGEMSIREVSPLE